MKLSNFKLIETIGSSPLDIQYFAEVDVTTGLLFGKKTIRRQISRKFADYWFFTDTGEFVPDGKADELARVWQAKTGQAC